MYVVLFKTLEADDLRLPNVSPNEQIVTKPSIFFIIRHETTYVLEINSSFLYKRPAIIIIQGG